MREKVLSVTANDCRWEYFRGTGAGGQKRNKTSNCVRCTHELSGAVGEARDSRSQRDNRESAFRRMCESKKMQTWLRIETARRIGKLMQIDDAVDREMKRIRVDRKNSSGLWEEWPDHEQPAGALSEGDAAQP